MIGDERISASVHLDVYDCFVEDGKIVLYGNTQSSGMVPNGYVCVTVIPTDMPVGTEIDCRCVKTESDKIGSSSGWEKPIIYLYPENEQEVSVTLSDPDLIDCSYPVYGEGWNVIARPDGSLMDTRTGRSLYALYYESDLKTFPVLDSGFVVKGEDSAASLEEKLSHLGLTNREAEEFIVYWLPCLEAHSYNLIHFMTEDEIASQMDMDVDPAPDTEIRVWMAFKDLDHPIDIEEQVLPDIPERRGFTLVEWGGTKL